MIQDMKKLFSLLTLLLVLMPSQTLALSDEAKALLKRQKDLYHTEKTEAFMDVSEQLKAIMEKEGEEQLFYNAWNQQITYALNNIGTSEAIKMLKEMRDYVEDHDSKYGFLLVTYLNAHIAKNLGMDDRARDLMEQAMTYQKRYLPDLKPPLQPYYFLARYYGDLHQGDKVVAILDKALQQKGWGPEEEVILWSLKCNAVTHQEKVDTARFFKYYQQMHEVMKRNGYQGSAAIFTECHYAEYKNDYPRLMSLAQGITDKGERLRHKITAYDGLGRKQEALDSFKVYNAWMSQQHNDETRKLAEISALEVESSRAENEADTLRLTNQRMILTVIIWGFIILTIILVLYIRRRLIQMRQLKAAYDQLEAVTAQKERIESELRIARDIQMAMVPSNFSLREDVDIYANMTPAKAVGGDLYDIFIINDHLYFCIGDVSGKGVPAALFMAVSMSLFRAYSAEEVQPDRIVARMNKSLGERNKKHMFVTMFVGILDLKSGELCYCNAGHEAPLIIDKEVRELPVIRNLPVGAVRKATYQMQTTTIEPQSTILLYTDGLSEAMDADKQMYGRERIVEEVEQACQAGQYVPKTLIEQLTQSVHSFVGDTEQSDDITMIALSRK